MSWNQQPSWNRSQTDGPAIISSEKDAVFVGAFLAKVYLWMFAGLLITSVTAFAVAASPALVEALIVNRLGFWIIVIAQLGLVFYLAARVDKIEPATAAGLFILYSALVGVTSSAVLKPGRKMKSKISPTVIRTVSSDVAMPSSMALARIL